MTAPKLVTFDVYSALLDIEGSLTAALAEALGRPADETLHLVRIWRAKQMERAAASNSLGLGRTRFRDATAMALDYVIRRHELDLADGRHKALVLAWDRIQAWPEAAEVVGQVKARGTPVAILSNGDQDMLEAVAAHNGLDFDHIFSSESAGAYKPHPDVYALPCRELGLAKDEILHVVGSANDVLGAAAYGLPCLWSNRSGDAIVDPAYPPDHEATDLKGLLDIL